MVTNNELRLALQNPKLTDEDIEKIKRILYSITSKIIDEYIHEALDSYAK